MSDSSNNLQPIVPSDSDNRPQALRVTGTLMPNNSFDRLATELLLHIQSFIGYEYIWDHICFAFTCRRFKSLYPDDKWQDLLRLGGYGKPLNLEWLKRHHLPGENSWEDLAISIARHMVSCSFGPCGEYYGRPYFFQRKPDAGYYEPEVHGSCYPLLTKTDVEKGNIKCKGFCASSVFAWNGSTREIAGIIDDYARTRDDEVILWKYAEAACKFATDPPVTELTIMVLGILEVDIVNPDGVTVFDCLKQIYDYGDEWDFDIDNIPYIYEDYVDRFEKMSEFDFLRDTTVGQAIDFLYEWRQSQAASEQNDQGLAELIQQIDLFCYMIPPACYPVPLLHATQTILHAFRGIAPVSQWTTLRDFLKWCERLGPTVTESQWYTTLDYNLCWSDLLRNCCFIRIWQSEPGSTTFISEWRYNSRYFDSENEEF
ncbi:uncharacterized protein STEHIDRAFT_145652, partial [Stereum hirsutum FP-91666 SS1]|uniref:uncharacterized protein n=1 Tax=Stereum hirsutum (strain FP-91666) TaxID=721885 RepID=UPI000440C1D7